MKPAIALLGALGVLAAFPCSTQAQWGRYGRGGVVYGPDGPLYDTRSPEWRMSGGNIFVYQQLMDQKMLLRQQQMVMRQQQRMMKQAQQNTRKGTRSAHSARAGNLNGPNGLAPNGQQAPARPARRGKKPQADATQAPAAKAGRAPSSPSASKVSPARSSNPATGSKTHSEIEPSPSDRPPPD